MTYLLRLSWPRPPLWANSRAHWRVRSDATRAYRQEAWAAACGTTGLSLRDWSGGAALRFDFYPPDRRKRDAQNMPATVKAAIDGIADAMRVDDSQFQCVFPGGFCDPVKGGAVLVTVEALNAEV